MNGPHRDVVAGSPGALTSALLHKGERSATPETWLRRPDSNWQPLGYESSALPLRHAAFNGAGIKAEKPNITRRRNQRPIDTPPAHNWQYRTFQATIQAMSLIAYLPNLQIDTDQRRSVIRELTDSLKEWLAPTSKSRNPKTRSTRLGEALYQYLSLEINEMERGEAARLEAIKNPVELPFFGPKPTPEMLIEASEDIETLRGRVEALKEQFALAQSGTLGPMIPMMEVSVLGPMEEMLRQKERYLSQLQKHMEHMEQTDVPG